MRNYYLPTGLVEKSFFLASKIPGKLGEKSFRELRRQYEKRCRAEFEKILQDLKPEDCVVDCGANIGDITVQLARTGATVHSYEPDPDTFERLKETCEQFDNVTLFQEAVALSGGTAKFFRNMLGENADRYNPVGNSIRPNPQRQYQKETIDVPVTAFEEVISRCPKRPRIVKMDIEGAEVEILAAMYSGELPMDFENIFIELHRNTPESHALLEEIEPWGHQMDAPRMHFYWP